MNKRRPTPRFNFDDKESMKRSILELEDDGNMTQSEDEEES